LGINDNECIECPPADYSEEPFTSLKLHLSSNISDNNSWELWVSVRTIRSTTGEVTIAPEFVKLVEEHGIFMRFQQHENSTLLVINGVGRINETWEINVSDGYIPHSWTGIQLETQHLEKIPIFLNTSNVSDDLLFSLVIDGNDGGWGFDCEPTGIGPVLVSISLEYTIINNMYECTIG
jgi:hypothetical protein